MKPGNMKRGLALPFIRTIPFKLISKAGHGNLVVFYSHLVSDTIVPHVDHLYKYKNPRQFLEDLAFIQRHYSPIEPLDVIHWSKGTAELPPNRFLLTFDDGLREIHDTIAPILLSKGIPAIFFVSSAFIDNKELCYQHKASLLAEIIGKGVSPRAEREMAGVLATAGIPFQALYEGILKIDYGRKETLDELAQVLQVDFEDYLNDKQPYLTSGQVRNLLDQGFAIGAHSIDHPLYSNLSLAEQLRQTYESVMLIRETFQLEYGVFAFPHHDRGVSREFFRSVAESGLVDMTFGTGGMLDTDSRTHRQRVSLENPLLPARDLISWQYLRKALWDFKEKTNAYVAGTKGST
jgi:peptidoglycan/xylan/chitin deacetylase (PgdA/CDA1 family)